jgi:hypothetical protein
MILGNSLCRANLTCLSRRCEPNSQRELKQFRIHNFFSFHCGPKLSRLPCGLQMKGSMSLGLAQSEYRVRIQIRVFRLMGSGSGLMCRSRVSPFRFKKIFAYKRNKANLDPFHMCFTISLKNFTSLFSLLFASNFLLRFT